MSIKVKFKWTFTEQKVFANIKWIMACNYLLAYTYLNKKIGIHTDASNFQLGAVIRQGGKQTTFYSRKMIWPQKSYTVTEKELPRIN